MIFKTIVISLAGTLASALATAQAYPTRPIRLIVPFAAGQGADVAARLIAQKLGEDIGVQLFGGYGFMWEYPITRAYADARVQRIYGGTNEIMKEVIARAMGLSGR